MGIANGEAVEIHDRKGEPRAGEELSRLDVADRGVETRGGAAKRVCIERVEGGAELSQRLAAEKRRKQEAVGDEFGAGLDEAADGIVGEAEAEDRDHEVEAGGRGLEARVLRRSGERQCGMPLFGEAAEEHLCKAVRGDEEGARKGAVHVLQTLGDVVGDAGEEKAFAARTAAGGAHLAGAHEALIEDGGRLALRIALHGAGLRVRGVEGKQLMRGMRAFGAAALDVVFPPPEIDVAGLRMLDAPLCARCGYPFEVAMLEAVECGACMARSPRYGRARSAFAYDEGSKPLVLEFKHGGRTGNIDLFAVQMMRAGREVLDEADALVPVPLHPKRLRRRKFNQAALLANRVGKLAGVEVRADLLHRVRDTASQGMKSAKGRKRNVAGAFEVRGEMPERVVLVDDVMTTGATLEACALALTRAGAAQVDALCLARVVRERSPT